MNNKRKVSKKIKSDINELQLAIIKPPKIRQPKGNGIYLDIAQNGLYTFPDFYLSNSQLVLLYLEGNHLTVLPHEVFICFPYLKWLDIRNNGITYIPDSVKFHLRLETFLVQGNSLRYLPPELGTVQNLKTLQIKPNPLEYPSEDILSEGTEKIKEYLHEEFKKHCPEYVKYLEDVQSKYENNKIEPEATRLIEPTAAEKMYKELVKMPKVFHIEKNTTGYMKRLSEISFDIFPPIKVQKYSNPIESYPFDAMGILSVLLEAGRKPLCKKRGRKNRGNLDLGEVQVENGQIKLKLEETKNIGKKLSSINPKKIEKILEKLLEDLKNAKIVDRNSMSEKILSLRRNVESQERFKQLYRTKSYYSFANNPFKGTVNPFGTSEEYNKMMTRSELMEISSLPYKTLNQKFIKRLQPKRIDFNKEIIGLLDALHNITLNVSEDEDSTPGVMQRALCQDMSKIAAIQKSLAALKIQNYNH